MGESGLVREVVLEAEGKTWRAPVGTSLQIGRHPRNEVMVGGTDVSRFHATVRWEGQRLLVEDRASANGTRVDGETISGPRELRGGELIGVGSHELAVRIEDPSAPALLDDDEDDDVIDLPGGVLEQGHFASGRRREDDQVLPSVADVLLGQERLRSTVVVELSHAAEKAEVVLAQGRLVAATCGERTGLEALERILHLPQGRFRVVARAVPTEGDLNVSVTEYLRLGYWEMRLRGTQRWNRAGD
ncbi:MAG: FHA domain-containing protein [Planctomycetota bacterium]